MWNTFPRFCTCISFRFQFILQSIFPVKECHLFVPTCYHVDELAEAHQKIHENKMGDTYLQIQKQKSVVSFQKDLAALGFEEEEFEAPLWPCSVILNDLRLLVESSCMFITMR